MGFRFYAAPPTHCTGSPLESGQDPVRDAFEGESASSCLSSACSDYRSVCQNSFDITRILEQKHNIRREATWAVPWSPWSPAHIHLVQGWTQARMRKQESGVTRNLGRLHLTVTLTPVLASKLRKPPFATTLTTVVCVPSCGKLPPPELPLDRSPIPVVRPTSVPWDRREVAAAAAANEQH